MKSHLLILPLLFFLFSCQENFKVSIFDLHSCADYLAEHPRAGNGYYSINLDQDVLTPPQRVYCDFSGGGWTRVLSSSTVVGDLDEFGDTSGIAATFYTDPVLGIGWGDQANTGGSNPNPTQMECFTFSKVKSFSEIKMTLSWDGIQGNGYLYASNEISPSRYVDAGSYYAILYEEGMLTSMNAWSGTVGGRERVVQAKVDPEADVTLAEFIGNGAGESVTVTQTYSSNGNFQICMSGENPNPYDRRFIKSLSFK